MAINSYYKSSKHKAWRNSVLKRDGYLCQSCKRQGIHIDGNHAHHILPRKLYPQYQSKLWNGVSLCEACHNELEPRSGEYTPADWLLRRLSPEAVHVWE